MEKVLLLNASHEPLNVCSWRRALVLLLKGKAEGMELSEESTITEKIKKLDNDIEKFKKPVVIKLRYYVAVPYKELPFSKHNILVRDNYTCQYCGKKTRNLTLDHIYPKSRGGEYSWKNIVAACPTCNQIKADRTPKEAGMKLIRRPFKPRNAIEFELKKHGNENYEAWQEFIAG